MTDLLTLIKKLLKQVPNRITSCVFDDSNDAEYLCDNLKYSIRYSCYNTQYFIHLNIARTEPYWFILHEAQIEVSEKDYMETKWKIEEWKNYLEEQYLNQFEEFVDSFSDNSMDSLLNE